jgi:uncharacterized protein with HEPN domain
MFDKELTIEVLQQVLNSAETIMSRFEPVKEVSDFTDSSAGMEKMDSICMLLIVIGESLKNLDKITDGRLMPGYPEVDWKKAIKMRDILTHHYTDVNAEAVFNTCREKIPELIAALKKILRDIN